MEQPGGLEALQVTEVADPQPAPDEVVIDVAYAACNWMDTEKRRGVYPDRRLTYPTVLGNEVSGVVSRVGHVVSEFQIGDRVAAVIAKGGYAEKCIAPAVTTMKLPDKMNLALGASFQISALTAYHLLFSAYHLRVGDVVLVHALGGALGLIITQIAKEYGAKIIGTVSSAAKGENASKFGADRIIVRSEEDFVQSALEFTGGVGVDLVIDSLGGETGFRSHDALRYYGHLINIGEAEDWPWEKGLRDKLYERSTSFSGFEMLAATPGSDCWKQGVKYILPRVADGRIQVPIAGTYSLAKCQEMHRDLEARSVSGKLLLAI